MNLRPSRWAYGAAPMLLLLVGVLAAIAGLAYPASSQASRAGGSCSQYALAPTISGLSPSSGQAGDTVTITGNHFAGNSEITSLKFAGGKGSPFTVNSKTKLTTIVPTGASTGGITVTNCAGSATTATFTVGGGSGAGVRGGGGTGASCVVPKVIGKTLPAAKKAIAKAHCKTGTVKKVKSAKKKNTVVKQSSKAGKHLASGSKITLSVSKGK